MQTVRNRIFLYLIILCVLSIVTGCANLNFRNLNAINIPDSIRYGECEKEISELKGDTSRDLINLSIDTIDKISFCRMEKSILIKYIDEYNKTVRK